MLGLIYVMDVIFVKMVFIFPCFRVQTWLCVSVFKLFPIISNAIKFSLVKTWFGGSYFSFFSIVL